jgi:hypothetical protein
MATSGDLTWPPAGTFSWPRMATDIAISCCSVLIDRWDPSMSTVLMEAGRATPVATLGIMNAPTPRARTEATNALRVSRGDRMDRKYLHELGSGGLEARCDRFSSGNMHLPVNRASVTRTGFLGAVAVRSSMCYTTSRDQDHCPTGASQRQRSSHRCGCVRGDLCCHSQRCPGGRAPTNPRAAPELRQEESSLGSCSCWSRDRPRAVQS